MNISLENWIRNKLQEVEEMRDYAVATDTVRAWIDIWKELRDPISVKVGDILIAIDDYEMDTGEFALTIRNEYVVKQVSESEIVISSDLYDEHSFDISELKNIFIKGEIKTPLVDFTEYQ